MQADELRKELSEVKAELEDLNERLIEAEQEYEDAQTQLRKADVEQEEQLQRWVPPAFLTSRAHAVKWTILGSDHAVHKLCDQTSTEQIRPRRAWMALLVSAHFR